MNRKTRPAFSFILTLTICLLSVVAVSRAQPAKPIAANQPVTIPFELVTRHIMVKVKINNSRPLSFVFDTGDKVCVVDTEVANELGLKMEGQLRVGGAGGETLPASFIKEANWSLPGLEGFSQPVGLTFPLGRIAARFGHDFDGIIGSDFIKNFVVEVDYQNHVLKLHDKDSFSYSGSGESIPVQLSPQGHPHLDGALIASSGEAIRGKFVLDLGSSGSLVVMSPVVTEHKLLNNLKTIKAVGVGGAGGQSNGQIGRVAELQIGRFKIPNALAMFSQDTSGAMATSALIGNIGQQIASKFKLFLDYSHSRIILEPNSTFDEPMARLSSGIVFTTEGKGHAIIRVSDVLESSPASEAGVQKDDIIISLDGRPASELTVTKLMEMFEQPQSRKLTIKRGEQQLNFTLRPRKLI